jgi:hypothetical protein
LNWQRVETVKYLSTVHRGIIVRVAVAITMAIVALSLFVLNRGMPPEVVPDPVRLDNSGMLEEIDHAIDRILFEFAIDTANVKKKAIPIPDTDRLRIERRVTIPESLAPIAVNAALNTMAHKYNGRAIASENLRENTVTVHIELHGYLVQTIILKPSPNPKRAKAPRV